MAEKKLKAAIIGCGGIHHTHAKALHMLDQAEITVVVDIDEEKAKKSAEENHCGYLTDYKELENRQDVDVVHICTPHYLHPVMAMDMLRSGKHVFCEKPMSISVEDAEAMIRTAEETGKYLGICFQNRYNDTSVRAKELISSGKVGKIKGARASVTWHREGDYYTKSGWRGSWKTEGGGTLINQSIHTMDLMNWLCGPAVKIKGHTDTFMLRDIIEVEDTAMANVLFENGANGLFFATNCNPVDAPIELTIYCEKATLAIKDSLTITYEDGSTEIVTNESKLVGEKNYWGSGHIKIIDDFYTCILENKPFSVPASEGIHAISLLQGIYASEKENAYIDVK